MHIVGNFEIQIELQLYHLFVHFWMKIHVLLEQETNSFEVDSKS